MVELSWFVLQYHLYTALPGEFVGVLAVVTGEPSFFNVKATKQCHVVIISKANFYRWVLNSRIFLLNFLNISLAAKHRGIYLALCYDSEGERFFSINQISLIKKINI